MEALISDLVAHNISNRKVALIENGSWAPTSGGLMRKQLEKCDGVTFIENTVSIRSSVKAENLEALEALAEAIAADMPKTHAEPTAAATGGEVDNNALLKVPYGLYVLTARDGNRDNGCIINTVMQVTNTPNRISIAVNKNNYTHDMILHTGVFNLSAQRGGAVRRVQALRLCERPRHGQVFGRRHFAAYGERAAVSL